MPTLAIGKTEPAANGGFSLVETVATVAVIGLAVGAVALALPGAGASVRPKAERLAAQLTHAADASILDGVGYGARIDDRGYAFYRIEEATWRAVSDDPALARHDWDGIAAVAETMGGVGSTVSGRSVPNVIFDPTGMSSPFRVTLRRGDAAIDVVGDDMGTIKVTEHARDP